MTAVVTAVLGLPVLVKVLATLAFILALNAVTRSLLAAVAAGTVLLGFWAGHGALSIGWIARERFFAVDNLLLLLSFFLIIWLSSLMSDTGVMRDLVATVRARVPHRAAFAALPAVIGLLPMPGGAVFSAPMVDRADVSGSIPAWVKTQANYWFRHIWEYWWPLYPGVLLALDLTGLEYWRFLAAQLPMTGVAVLAGYLFFLRRIPSQRTGGPSQKTGGPSQKTGGPSQRTGRAGGSLGPAGAEGAAGGEGEVPRGFLGLVAPILTVIVVYLGLQLAVPSLTRISRYLPMLIGLVLALGVLQVQRRPGLHAWKKTLLARRAFEMAALIAVIRVYGAIIESRLPGGVLLVEQMQGELTQFGIPEQLFIVLIPFIAGLALGLNVGTIGASFPVVLSLLGPAPATSALLSLTVLAYAWGYAGQLLSPVHVCLVVTGEYFKTSLLHNMARVVAPIGMLLAGAYGLSRMLALLGGA
ncbi:MAG: DUF401 family protein [Spirochaetales bacterium]|nr:DUF401 family protein [Spirochaetales bacterium]